MKNRTFVCGGDMVTSWLIQNWHMSSVMVDVVRYHHKSLEKIKEAFPAVKTVFITNLFNGKSADVKILPEIDGMLTGLRHSDMQAIVEGVAEEVEQIASSLKIMIQKPSNAGDAHAISVGKQSGRAAVVDATQDKEEALQEDLKARIKSISLLSNFLPNSVPDELRQTRM